MAIEHETDTVKVKIRDHIMILSIDRPRAKNAMVLEAALTIETALDRLDNDPELRVGIITGTGGVFCAGADLKRLALGEVAFGTYRGFGGIVKVPPRKPMIAAVDGLALGGGFEIALACDLIVASEQAYFALPEVKRGLVARGGGALRLGSRIPRAIALELLMLGAAVTAQRAAELGLVNRLVPAGEALDAAVVVAKQIAENAPLAVQVSKQIVNSVDSWAADQLFEEQWKVVEPVFASEDAAEGVRAFAEKRSPEWKGR